MGKDQKMKKAAAARAATASAAANVAAKVVAAATDNNNNSSSSSNTNANNAISKKSALIENVEDLKTLCEKLESMSTVSNSDNAASLSDSDDEPDSEQMPLPQPRRSRGEKMARRLLMKLDLQRIPNVSRVAMRKSRDKLLYIDQPEVYQCTRSKTFIFFGVVHIDDVSNAATAQAADRYINDAKSSHQSPDAIIVNNSDDEDIDVDALGSALDEKDIELVEMQASCSRKLAITALLKHNSDVVNAIMELTLGPEYNA